MAQSAVLLTQGGQCILCGLHLEQRCKVVRGDLPAQLCQLRGYGANTESRGGINLERGSERRQILERTYRGTAM